MCVLVNVGINIGIFFTDLDSAKKRFHRLIIMLVIAKALCRGDKYAVDEFKRGVETFLCCL